MKLSLVYRWINGLFLFVLIVPIFAVSISPRLKQVVAVTIQSPDEWNQQKEILRRSTYLWNKAVEGYSNALFKLGSSNSRSVATVGQDGWVFLGDAFESNISQALGRRYYNEQDIASWTAALKERESWLARRGVSMLFVVAPAKWSIYPDKLPAWTQGRIGKHCFDQLLSELGNLPFIDLRPSLRAARKTADTYSRLNSHWNSYGAWVAWSQIAKRLAALDSTFSNLLVPIVKSIETVDQYNEFASMVNLTIPNPWSVPVLEKPLPDIEIMNTGLVVPGVTQTNLLDMPRKIHNLASGNHHRALVLRDSMGDSLSPYLQAAFEETYQVRHYMDQPYLAPNVPILVESYKPTVMIYIMTERFLNHILQDGEFWAAANAYDLSDVQVAKWSYGEGATENSSLQGDSNSLVPVTYTWNTDAKAPNVLRVDLSSSAPGSINLKVRSKNIEISIIDQYVEGENVLFFKLPEQLDNNQITMARSGNADTKLQYKGITVRAYSHKN